MSERISSYDWWPHIQQALGINDADRVRTLSIELNPGEDVRVTVEKFVEDENGQVAMDGDGNPETVVRRWRYLTDAESRMVERELRNVRMSVQNDGCERT